MAKCIQSVIGTIVEEEWLKIAQPGRGVSLDRFILMPNHLHGIIALNIADDLDSIVARSIGAIVAGFKAAVSAAAAKQVPSGISRPIWQRGFHDRITRDEAELLRFQEYIANNLAQWELDRHFGKEDSAKE
jgi:REP element-mobilizing transposase RayT